MKKIERYVDEEHFRASDVEIRKRNEGFGICIWYSFNNYGCSISHVLELRDAIRAEYPDKKDTDMEVWFVEPHQSTRHALYTTLRVSIPVEDFIKLRQEHKIGIL